MTLDEATEALAEFARTLPNPQKHPCFRYDGPCEHETEAHKRLYAWAQLLPKPPMPPLPFPEGTEGD